MAEPAEPTHERWRRRYYLVWTLVGALLLIAAAGWAFGKVFSAFVPFLLALVVIYLFRRPVAALEGRGLSRTAAVSICLVVFLGVIGLIIGFVMPSLVTQVQQFVIAFPDYYDELNSLFVDLQARYDALVAPPWLEEAVVNIQATLTEQSATWSQALATRVFSVGGSAVTLLGYTVLALVVAFWVLKDLPIIAREGERLVVPHRRAEMRVILAKISDTLGGYLRGQLLLAVATGLIIGVALWVLGVPYSMVIGLIGAVLNIIPWIGPAITAVVAGVAGATVEPWFILWSVLVVIGAQQLTEWFVQPRVMSGQVDLHPLLVIFSILAGGTLFGFPGIVLAIPVAAIGKALFVYYFEKYTDSVLSTADGALFRTRRTSEGHSARREQAPSGDPGCTADVPADTERRPEEGDS